MKTERIDWLADNPFYTKRFGHYIGRRCEAATISDVAREFHLDWKTEKELEKQYMREKLRRAAKPNPKVVGIDEISIRKGHIYRIVVSDLEKRRPIWFGGVDRSEKSMDLFYEWLSPAKTKRIRLAVMDMWKPFEQSTRQKAPQASILYDKFHVIGHLNDALDKIRTSEYARLAGKDRKFIKGQKYTLLSHRANLTIKGRKSLKLLLSANKRLNTARLQFSNDTVRGFHLVFKFEISNAPGAYNSRGALEGHANEAHLDAVKADRLRFHRTFFC